MFMVLGVKKSIEVSVFGEKVEIPFSSAGFYGVCPIFETEQEAKEWADGKFEVIRLTTAST